MTLEISGKHVQEICSHSRESHSIEACGILIGTISGETRKVAEVWRAKNQLSSESSYEIDPDTLFRAFSYAERNNLAVVGFYHSHPFWSASASDVDKARANYPGLSYLIYSITKNDVASFYFDGRHLIEEPVEATGD